MSKRLAITTVICGAVLLVAPMAGIAEDTAASIQTEAAVEQADTRMGKAKAYLVGAGTQFKDLYNSVTAVDERLIRKDKELTLAKQRIIELEASMDQKTFVEGLSLVRAKSCAETITEFLNTQIEGK